MTDYIYVGYMETRQGPRLCGNTYFTYEKAVANIEALHKDDLADARLLKDNTEDYVRRPLGVWKVKKSTYDNIHSTLADFDLFIPYGQKPVLEGDGDEEVN